MRVTGRNLVRLRVAVDLALAELHNQIATCPDVIEYADAIEELEADQELYRQMLTRIDKAIAKEQP